jgi:hypothetical protein
MPSPTPRSPLPTTAAMTKAPTAISAAPIIPPTKPPSASPGEQPVNHKPSAEPTRKPNSFDGYETTPPTTTAPATPTLRRTTAMAVAAPMDRDVSCFDAAEFAFSLGDGHLRSCQWLAGNHDQTWIQSVCASNLEITEGCHRTCGEC